jgi:DNA processing protein
MSALDDVARDARAVAHDGTDPSALAAILAWTCGPRRSPDSLRRRLRDASAGDVGLDGTAATSGIADRLARIARDDGGLDGPLADVAGRVIGRWAARGVRVAIVGDLGYPERLAEGWPDLDAPVLLAWRGEPPATSGPGVAIVGARNATPYGTAVAELLAAAVARAGGRVVSGGAVGIDAAAHGAALGLPGGTTVVLGCGHDVPYPVPHARPGGLFERVLEDGGTLVSELLPEVGAHPGVIRARNRIVAGLADATVVVEGGGRSGALLTATAAADRGREVLAVPGDITVPGSVAPLRLLAEGARVCSGPQDVLALLPTSRASAVSRTDEDPVGPSRPGSGLGHDPLPAAVHRALERAGPRGLAVEDLAPVLRGGAATLLAVLTRARIAGVVEDVPGGIRLRAGRDRPLPLPSLRSSGPSDPPRPPRPSDR